MYSEIHLELGSVSARVSPARGAIATSLSIGGTELLYLDRETFHDPAKNVRGGIPILFPFAGSLENGRLEASGTLIPQHGFARNQQWTVLSQSAATLRLGLESSPSTDEIYPWRFALEHSFYLFESGMHVEMLVRNNSDKPMPVAPGWHPYFNCPVDAKRQIAGNIPGSEAGRVHDEGEVNYGIVAATDGRVEYYLPGAGSLRLEFSPEMRHVQVWSLPGRPFVCIEPFAGPSNLINTVPHLVPPRGACAYWMRIGLLP